MNAGKIQAAGEHGDYRLKFTGDVRLTLCNSLDQFLDKMFKDPGFHSVLIDLTQTEGIDSTSLGMLAKLAVQAKKRFEYVPTIVSTNPDITRILLSMGFDRVFNLLETAEFEAVPLKEIVCETCSEQVVKGHVLNAHRTLMDLNERNREAFSELVKNLESK
ncbi:STAS domain-containing protein [Aestuariirhabdus litorea]|uniref:Anti-sigma factor antagonist n=1 Tax=Aestuariirhabdus litorea TaxID=2528527 RepID=A0A3P3VT21_9GAMM|nr:STAS domain-containing protein [Aestuariirhabdus litorea]RRJ84836.1 anti-sigma factor antagonist [Aestuariirhabdus litorea]RWW98061.1 STAS domain-containing protein [Endozoicomonadaceae bacterium GTF-13]